MDKESKKFKRDIKRFYKSMHADDPSGELPSLQENNRIMWYDDDRHEYGDETEYGYLPDFLNDATDEEIMEYYRENIRLTVPRYQKNIYWDCSGYRFSWNFKFHRNPNGKISFRHETALDI